jgi:Ser/Thr protein kinase RdoA (MazF antagonist)
MARDEPRQPNARVEPAALAPVVEEAYDLPGPVTCTWIRRGFNDHYLVETTGGNRAGKYVLRLYFNHKYWIGSPGDFRFELELLRFVRARGVAVAPPVPRRDGDLLGAVETDAGTRSYALFEFVDGAIRGPLTESQARALGRTLAQFHVAADAFRPSLPEYRRYHMDLRYLLDQPVELLEALLSEHGRQGLMRYRPRLAEIRARVLALPKADGAYGVIHGDPHRGNAAVTESGEVTLFDFDHGGFGWRAYDLAVCWGSLAESVREACFRGYEDVRPLSPAARELLPTFRTLNSIWDLGDVLAMRAAWGPGADQDFGPEFADQAEQRLERLFGK